jgi:hypothetical protein
MSTEGDQVIGQSRQISNRRRFLPPSSGADLEQFFDDNPTAAAAPSVTTRHKNKKRMNRPEEARNLLSDKDSPAAASSAIGQASLTGTGLSGIGVGSGIGGILDLEGVRGGGIGLGGRLRNAAKRRRRLKMRQKRTRQKMLIRKLEHQLLEQDQNTGFSSTGISSPQLSTTSDPIDFVRNNFATGFHNFNNDDDDYYYDESEVLDNQVDKSNRVVGGVRRQGPRRRRLGGLAAATGYATSGTGSAGLTGFSGTGLGSNGFDGTRIDNGLIGTRSGASRYGGTSGLGNGEASGDGSFTGSSGTALTLRTGLLGLGASGLGATAADRSSGYGHSGGHSGGGGGGGPVIVLKKNTGGDYGDDDSIFNIFDDTFGGLDYNTFALIFAVAAVAAGILIYQSIVAAGKRKRNFSDNIIGTTEFIHFILEGM